jgi:hypothetical protein
MQPLLQGKSDRYYISQCVFVGPVKQCEHMRRIGICGLPGCAVFCTLSHRAPIFEKKSVIEHKMCFSIVSTNFV